MGPRWRGFRTAFATREFHDAERRYRFTRADEIILSRLVLNTGLGV